MGKHEKNFKRMIALNSLGSHLYFRDGHTWIGDTSDEVESIYSLRTILMDNKILLNTKIYGGILEALDTVDEALFQAVGKKLVDFFEPSFMFMGDGGIDRSRIDKVKVGGGLN